MATISSRQFIEAALSCTSSSFALSYADPNQKWIIQQHLISLLQDFPSLVPGMDTFTHNDGTTVNLLKANGEIHVSPSTPPILLTIWIHENYPTMAPIVFVASSNQSFPVYNDHPFVDSSGATTSSYLANWTPGCNLSELARNLVKLLSHHHPFYYSPCPWITHLSFISKREAMDRLACILHYDMMELRSKTAEEIEQLTALQDKLRERADIVTGLVIGLENEHKDLKGIEKKLTDEADVLLNWLKVYNRNPAISMVGDDHIDDAFEAVDENSRMVLECLAADKALEDLMYALDKAVEQGIFSFDAYVKQVRSLARTQFWYRAQRIKFERLRN
ncbi:hypothetical protein ACH5RR_010608 [Cinchona calisaya]|uniref:Protein ELC-like n=1 Tax=Cinchona calisaya TaxID=153742 RepID=A0ABD3AJE1_9GENT